MAEIHPTAVVHPDAQIAKSAKIGPFAIVEANVRIGEGSVLHSSSIVKSFTTLGDNVNVHSSAVVGGEPQHLGFKGEETHLIIESGVTLREFVTVHRGTVQGGGITRIHENAYLMAYTHVGHDCQIGRGVVIANACQLGGHVQIGDFAFLGGVTAVPQFCRVGAYAYVGGVSCVRKDLAPFMLAKGVDDLRVQGINVIGLERRGFSSEAIQRLKKLYRIFYVQRNTVSQAIEKITTELGDFPEVATFIDFVRSSKIGVIR